MNPMIEVAVNRMNFWRRALETAERASQTVRAEECARFVKEYDQLVETMLQVAREEDLPKA